MKQESRLLKSGRGIEMDGATHGNPQLPTREWLTGRVMVLLSHFYTPDTDPAIVRAQAADWWDVLRDVPQSAIEAGCREFLRNGPPRRPTPGEVRSMALAVLPRRRAMNEDDLALAGPPRERVSAEAASEIMRQAGFRPRTF
jgi:hypothetical protein